MGDGLAFMANQAPRVEVLENFCEQFIERVIKTDLYRYMERKDFEILTKPLNNLVEADFKSKKRIKERKASYKGMFTLSLNILCRTLQAKQPEKTTLPEGVISQDWLKEQESKSKEVAKDLDTDFSEFEIDPFTDDFEFTNDFDMDEDTDLNTNEPDSTEFEFEEPVLDDDNIPVLDDVIFEEDDIEEPETKQDFSKLSVRNDILKSEKEQIEQKQSAAEIIFSTKYNEVFSRYYKFVIALMDDDYEAYTELHKEIVEIIKTKYLYKVKRYKAIAELEKQGKSIEEIQNFLDMLDEYNKIIGK